jgi:hypothetical protein
MAKWPKGLFTQPSAQEVFDSNGTLIFRGLRARIGLNTGHAFCTTDMLTGRSDYFGPIVNTAAKITSFSKGGDILFTQDTLTSLDSQTLQPEAVISDTSLTLGKRKRKVYRVLPVSIDTRRRYFSDDQVRTTSAPSSLTSDHAHVDMPSDESSSSSGSQGTDYANEEIAPLLRNASTRHLSNDMFHGVQQWIIPYGELRLGKKIGSGSFGEVFKASWRGTIVAVKRFYRQTATEQTLLELRKESLMMRYCANQSLNQIECERVTTDN